MSTLALNVCAKGRRRGGLGREGMLADSCAPSQAHGHPGASLLTSVTGNAAQALHMRNSGMKIKKPLPASGRGWPRGRGWRPQACIAPMRPEQWVLWGWSFPAGVCSLSPRRHKESSGGADVWRGHPEACGHARRRSPGAARLGCFLQWGRCWDVCEVGGFV